MGNLTEKKKLINKRDKVLSRGNKKLPQFPKTDVWTENKIEFTVPEGVTKARLVFYKPQLDPLLPSFFLDDVVVLKK